MTEVGGDCVYVDRGAPIQGLKVRGCVGMPERVGRHGALSISAHSSVALRMREEWLNAREREPDADGRG